MTGMLHGLATQTSLWFRLGSAIIYDAETTSGGSGGPVFNLEGEVIAINRATLPAFGGSNIGVPIGHAIALLRRLEIRLAP